MMRKSIFLLIAAAWACATPLSAQPGDVATSPATESESLQAESTLSSLTPEQIEELRFKLTKKIVRGVVRSKTDSLALAGAGVVFGRDTLRTDAEGGFVLTLPYEQETVALTVFPKEPETGRPEFGTETGEFGVDNLNVYLPAAWKWSQMLWVTLISICLVFLLLVLLVYIMKLFGVVFTHRQPAPVTSKPVSQGQLHEEEIAAITVALKLYKGALHDRESEVLTILSIKRAYSPWNSKIHGLTQMPDRK